MKTNKTKYNYYLLKFTGASFINNLLVFYAWDKYPQGVNPFETLGKNNRDYTYIQDPDNGEPVKLTLTAIMSIDAKNNKDAANIEIKYNSLRQYKGVEVF